MANLTTSAEAAAAALSGTELIRISQAGANKKATPAQVATYVSYNTIVKGTTQDRRHGGSMNATNVSAGAVAANTYRAFPVEIREPVTIDLIGIEITVGTTGKMRIIVHADDGTGYPGAYLGESGELTVTAPGVYEGISGSSLSLAAGLYWFILWTDTANTARSIAPAAMNPALGHSASGGTVIFGSLWNTTLMAYSSVTVVNPYPAGATIGNAATTTPNLYYRAT